MKIFPAIDVKDGRVVRLKYGDYQQMSVYDMAPC
ncbi:MAG: 1-(5-phosphoribosyl)-5-((5-phosphoribosylamino)methylideneamino)imidazole-4-carboxamide isomerase, partial [Firmicutes bacterium]|nr:1-(5-phosphoribosyl)-5-((5-phosphoribosylamino)methylideneamino)imidazole-4-carboxamide isomerase [Bacillota bacterium]